MQKFYLEHNVLNVLNDCMCCHLIGAERKYKYMTPQAARICLCMRTVYTALFVLASAWNNLCMIMCCLQKQKQKTIIQRKKLLGDKVEDYITINSRYNSIIMRNKVSFL